MEGVGVGGAGFVHVVLELVSALRLGSRVVLAASPSLVVPEQLPVAVIMRVAELEMLFVSRLPLPPPLAAVAAAYEEDYQHKDSDQSTASCHNVRELFFKEFQNHFT